MNDCDELTPAWLSFVKGFVDLEESVKYFSVGDHVARVSEVSQLFFTMTPFLSCPCARCGKIYLDVLDDQERRP